MYIYYIYNSMIEYIYKLSQKRFNFPQKQQGYIIIKLSTTCQNKVKTGARVYGQLVFVRRYSLTQLNKNKKPIKDYRQAEIHKMPISKFCKNYKKWS